MPTTNRPFFANFFAAFRTQSAFQKGTPAISSTASPSAPYTTSTPTGAGTIPSQIQAQAELSDPTTSIPARQKTSPTNTSTSPSAAAVATATAATAAAQSHFRSSRPLHVPNGTPQNRTNSTSPLPPSRTPSQTQTAAASSQPPPQTTGPNPQFPYSPPYSAQTRQRRGSDMSDTSASAGTAGGGGGSGGMWAGAVSPEKWYIGGRTATGEERFYKLGLVRKYDSADRLSLDRLSL